jgi:hypothetical protein
VTDAAAGTLLATGLFYPRSCLGACLMADRMGLPPSNQREGWLLWWARLGLGIGSIHAVAEYAEVARKVLLRIGVDRVDVQAGETGDEAGLGIFWPLVTKVPQGITG